jgi:hypothetical protein
LVGGRFLVVGRALNGRVIAPLTLHWFIEAFDMSPVDATDLWALRSGRDPARLAVVRAPEPGDGSSPPPNYQTIALQQLWWAIWPDHTARTPGHEESVALESDHSIHRYLDTLEGRTVGFHWRFPDALL